MLLLVVVTILLLRHFSIKLLIILTHLNDSRYVGDANIYVCVSARITNICGKLLFFIFNGVSVFRNGFGLCILIFGWIKLHSIISSTFIKPRGLAFRFTLAISL